MFQLTSKEKHELVTNWHRFALLKHSSPLPYVFTEHGVAMLSTVLNGQKAIKISILVIKAFVRLRELLSLHEDLAHKFAELERKVRGHDVDIQSIIEAVRELMQPPEKPEREMGFRIDRS